MRRDQLAKRARASSAVSRLLHRLGPRLGLALGAQVLDGAADFIDLELSAKRSKLDLGETLGGGHG
jgi:hypothetical protein